MSKSPAPEHEDPDDAGTEDDEGFHPERGWYDPQELR